MPIPRFSTLCSQARRQISQNVEFMQKEINLMQKRIDFMQDSDNRAAEFFASGMSFKLKDFNGGYERDILRDESGANYRNFLEDDIRPSIDKTNLLRAFDHNPQLAYAMFIDGYEYESEIKERDTM